MHIVTEFDAFLHGFNLLMENMTKSALFSTIPEEVIEKMDPMMRAFSKVMTQIAPDDETSKTLN